MFLWKKISQLKTEDIREILNGIEYYWTLFFWKHNLVPHIKKKKRKDRIKEVFLKNIFYE